MDRISPNVGVFYAHAVWRPPHETL